MLKGSSGYQASMEESAAEVKARKIRAANWAQYISGTFLGVVAVVFSVLNVFVPFYDSRFFDLWTVAPFFFGIGLIIYSGYRRQIMKLDYDLTEQEQSVSVSVEQSAGIALSGNAVLGGRKDEKKTSSSKGKNHNKQDGGPVDEQAMQSKAHLNSPFELYVNAIVSAIDKRINISEIKANNLLVQGRSLMFLGVIFYVSLVILFQLAVHSWGYSHALAVGMASASLVFLVFEFLAAWFLKQYRSYVDASMAYLQVRSAFNNYLLIYYSVNQFSEDSENRDKLIEVLTKDIKWPSINELGRYDVNHMLESVGSLSKVVDSLQAFKPGKKKQKRLPQDESAAPKTGNRG